MAFFTNSGAKVGSIQYYTASVGTPTSLKGNQKPPNYSIYTNGTLDTTKLVQKSSTNEYLNSGPKDYAGYYGNKEAGRLYFKYVKTDYVVVVPAIIESYNETFNPKFTSDQVYGRSDSNQKYSSTSRGLKLSFKLLGYDEEHARKNLHAVSTLTQFLYPIYDGANTGLSCSPLLIRENPMIRVRFSNLIQRSGRGSNMSSTSYSFEKDGLLTVPTNLSFQPELKEGFFFSSDNQYLYPKEIKVSMDFNIMHEETLGWAKTDKYHWIGKLDENGNLAKKNVDFPWGNDTIGSDTLNGVSAGTITLPSSTPTGGE